MTRHPRRSGAPLTVDPNYCAIEKHRARKVASTHTVTFPSVQSFSFNVCTKCAAKWWRHRFIVGPIASPLKEAA